MKAPTIDEMISSVEREIKMRRRVYPRRVESGKMRQDQSDREILLMEDIKQILEYLRDGIPFDFLSDPKQEELF